MAFFQVIVLHWKRVTNFAEKGNRNIENTSTKRVIIISGKCHLQTNPLLRLGKLSLGRGRENWVTKKQQIRTQTEPTRKQREAPTMLHCGRRSLLRRGDTMEVRTISLMREETMATTAMAVIKRGLGGKEIMDGTRRRPISCSGHETKRTPQLIICRSMPGLEPRLPWIPLASHPGVP